MGDVKYEYSNLYYILLLVTKITPLTHFRSHKQITRIFICVRHRRVGFSSFLCLIGLCAKLHFIEAEWFNNKNILIRFCCSLCTTHQNRLKCGWIVWLYFSDLSNGCGECIAMMFTFSNKVQTQHFSQIGAD